MDRSRAVSPGQCPVLDWAASGGMALTGCPDSAPVMSPAPSFGMLAAACEQLAGATRRTGKETRADPAQLLSARAALAGYTRRGRVSAGGASRLLRTADGWCAVTLSRPDDLAAVPAIIAILGLDGPGGQSADPWPALTAAARATSASALEAAAQLLGVPAGALPPAPLRPPAGDGLSADWPPWRVRRIAASSPAARLAGAVVVDLSSMWAGPLCARLLGLAGAQVVKVESPDRPDGARAGDQEFFAWLHAGHRSVAVDFRAESGRAALAALLRVADVVIEASRPRALAHLGLAPGSIPHRDGQVWLSITGYGRAEPGRVAFGDDAAAAGGLVGWTAGDGLASGGAPVFCADAVADPLTGLCGALAVAESVSRGGGELIDLPMQAVAASFAGAPGTCHGPHELSPGGAAATCHALRAEQAVLPPRRPAPARPAAELGADTAAVLTWLAPC